MNYKIWIQPFFKALSLLIAVYINPKEFFVLSKWGTSRRKICWSRVIYRAHCTKLCASFKWFTYSKSRLQSSNYPLLLANSTVRWLATILAIIWSSPTHHCLSEDQLHYKHVRENILHIKYRDCTCAYSSRPHCTSTNIPNLTGWVYIYEIPAVKH